MSRELEQFWISIYELCLAAELARLSIEIQTRSGLSRVGVPTVPDDFDPDWMHGDSETTAPVIEIDDEFIVVDEVVACAVFAPPAVLPPALPGSGYCGP